MSETSIITQEAFFSICNMHTDIRLGQTDLDLLSECVQLTPKFSHLYTSKLLVILIQEIDEKRANNGSFLGQKLGSFTQSWNVVAVTIKVSNFTLKLNKLTQNK